MEAVFGRRFNAAIPPTAFDNLDMWGSQENHIFFDDEETNRIWPVFTSVSAIPEQTVLSCNFTLLEGKVRVFLFLFRGICSRKYYSVCILTRNVFKSLLFAITFFKNQSKLFQMKTILASLWILLQVIASFCRYDVHTPHNNRKWKPL